MVKVAIEEPRTSTSLCRRTLTGIDTAIRLTNSQKVEFTVYPTGGTSPGQKRDWRVYDLSRRNGLSAFLYPSFLHYTVNATLWYITARDSILKFQNFSLPRILTLFTAWKKNENIISWSLNFIIDIHTTYVVS